MKEKIKFYLRNLLKYGTKLNENDTLIVVLSDMDKIVIECFRELKNEFKLKNVIFKEKNYKKIYNLLKNINESEINKYIPKLDIDSKVNDTKFIIFPDDSLSWFETTLLYDIELEDKYDKYMKIDNEKNSKFYELYSNCYITIGACVTKEWAFLLYGGRHGQKQLLWDDLLKTIPETEFEMKKYLDKLKEIKRYLNDLKIKELYFNTKLGTDFKIGLSQYSRWVNNFDNPFINEVGYLFNFPSYEIYTAPDMYTADGKIVISKASSLLGFEVNCGEITLEKGKIISLSTDNRTWERMLMIKENKLNRIGEIALVSEDSYIAKLKKDFDNLLLDENAGCHLAFGNSLKECYELVGIDNKEKCNFYDSLYHQDIVFGHSSINVSCKTFDGKKKVLIENGNWKI